MDLSWMPCPHRNCFSSHFLQKLNMTLSKAKAALKQEAQHDASQTNVPLKILVAVSGGASSMYLGHARKAADIHACMHVRWSSRALLHALRQPARRMSPRSRQSEWVV